MEFILDSADIEHIQKLNDILSIHGVTTNPTIITRAGKKAEDVIGDLCTVLNEDQLLFIQVVKTDYQGIIEEAREIAKLRPKNIIVKIPVTHDGLKAIKECRKLGIRTLATAIYSADQAFLAAMNGAEYLAPYVNRMDNYGDGLQQVKDLIEMLQKNQMKAKVIAASFKNVYQVHELIRCGIQAITVPCEIAYQMIDHPGTGIAVNKFSENWSKSFKRNSIFPD